MTPRVEARGKHERGVLSQVVLFFTLWSTTVAALSLLAVWPVLGPTLRDSGNLVIEPDGSSSITLNLEELGRLFSPASGVTLITSAAAALATGLSIWVMHRFYGGPSMLDLGFRLRPGWHRDILVGLALGPLMFLTILLVLVVAGWASVEPGAFNGLGMLTALATFMLVAIGEELVARGWILHVIERGHGTRTAVLASSGIFALLHAFNPGIGVMALLGLFAAGLLFAQAYLATRQLWLPIALHFSWNFSEGPIFGFPVSGLPAQGLLKTETHGPSMVTGGGFGPEAGLVVLVGVGLAAAVISVVGGSHAAAQHPSIPAPPSR